MRLTDSKLTAPILIGYILLLTIATVYLNVKQQKSIDRSKLPEKVELNKGFQKWITNLKKKDFDISADEFRLKEENEIYNTKWIKIFSVDSDESKKQYDANIEAHREIKKVIFSPSDREYIDYRNVEREGYAINEVHYYGLRDDKVIDARILDCSVRANCYFDRAYFLDNDVFVISEFSRNIDKKDQTAPECPVNTLCTYTIKIHLIDLINNKRYVYESKPFDIILADRIKDL